MPRVSGCIANYPLTDAAAAADAAGRLARVTRAELEARQQLELYADIEVPLAVVLAKMERAGMKLDVEELRGLSISVDADVTRLQAEIMCWPARRSTSARLNSLAGFCSTNSTLPAGRQNKTGYATGVDVLQGLARSFPIAAKVLEYREVSKLKNTYIDVLPTLIDPRDERLHTIFNQTTTATGDSRRPTPTFKTSRCAAISAARFGVRCRAVSRSDLARGRLLADRVALDGRICPATKQCGRLFTSTRTSMISPPARSLKSGRCSTLRQISAEWQSRSISGCFMECRISAWRSDWTLNRGEARAITTAYFARFPGVRAYIEGCLDEGRERGYVSTLLGRRRYMPDLRAKNYGLRAAAEREATNAPLQGSAADLMKLAMVRLDRRIASEAFDARMILQIHDELVFEVPARPTRRV